VRVRPSPVRARERSGSVWGLAARLLLHLLGRQLLSRHR
jgi:hypothetical protein